MFTTIKRHRSNYSSAQVPAHLFGFDSGATKKGIKCPQIGSMKVNLQSVVHALILDLYAIKSNPLTPMIFNLVHTKVGVLPSHVITSS